MKVLMERATIVEDMIVATRTTVVGLIASASLFFAGPPAANAADCSRTGPTQDQYCPPSTINFSGDPGDPSSADPTDPGLPFTGYDLGLAALAALGLVGAGVGLHRVARADEGT